MVNIMQAFGQRRIAAMFRWRSPFLFSLLQTRSTKSEPLLDQLKNCTTKYQVFQLLALNRPTMTVHHVGCTLNLLRKFQERDPENFETCDRIQDHQEITALCALAQDNVNHLDDKELVDILYALILLRLEAHNSLIQQLVVESWRRLERFDLRTLANLAECLKKQGPETSPLLGQIANLVDKNLEDTDDPVTLSSLLASLQAVSSPQLKERLINKTESFMQEFDLSGIRHAIRAIRTFQKYESTHNYLLEKYDNVFKQNIGAIGARNLIDIITAYQHLYLSSSVFPLMAQPILVDMINTCGDPGTYVPLFKALCRMENHHLRDRLQERLLTFLNELDQIQLLDVLSAMVDMRCKNRTLIQKVFYLLPKDLDNCSPSQLLNITEGLVKLPYENTKLLTEVQSHLQRNLIASFAPSEVAMLARALRLLNRCEVDEAVLSKIDAIIPQCNLRNIDAIAILLTEMLDEPFANIIHHNTCRELLQKLNRCALERLKHMDNIDRLEDEFVQLRNSMWRNEEVAKELLDTCERLLHQVTWRSVANLSHISLHINYACAPLLHTIAAVAMKDITKIHPSLICSILLPFGLLNYEPPQGREFFDICLQHVLEHKDLLNPSNLVQTCNCFYFANHHSKELIDYVFNTTFLSHFDDHVKSIQRGKALRIRDTLMVLNRAVCIEHPEYKIPWLHESYGQYQRKRVILNMKLVTALKEILGGGNYLKLSVTTPYCYNIAVEFTLDKNGKPISYQEQDTVSDNTIEKRDLHVQLPEGARRFAVDLLGSNYFYWNTRLNKYAVMKKRHLELLGYHVIQIPCDEWKHLMMTGRKGQIKYLKKRISTNY